MVGKTEYQHCRDTQKGLQELKHKAVVVSCV